MSSCCSRRTACTSSSSGPRTAPVRTGRGGGHVKSATQRAIVALAIGGVLTLGAFLGTFFWAGVPDFGFVRVADKVESVRYQGPFEQVIDEVRYLPNYVGFSMDVTTPDGSVSGVLSEVTDGGIVVETDAGAVDVAATDVNSV